MAKQIILILLGILLVSGSYAETVSVHDPTAGSRFIRTDYHAEDPPAIDHAGGPDPYGYMFRDITEPGGPDYYWVDITTTGTQWLDPPNNGDSGLLPFPFTFNFYGVDYTEFYIHSNGGISFTPCYLDYNNQSIPTGSYTDLIAPLWVDLAAAEGGEIWYGSAIVNEQNAMVVSWIDVPGPYGYYIVKFQCIMMEDGTFLFNYDSSSGLGWGWESIGIQQDGGTGLYISFHNDPNIYPYDGLAIEIFLDMDPAILDLTVTNGEVPVGGGAVLYDARFIYNLLNPFQLTYWNDIQLPSGGMYGPMVVQRFTAQPGMDVTVAGVQLDVPGYAPEGTYTLFGKVGLLNGPYVEDSFTFTKLATATGAEPVDEWSVTGGNFNLTETQSKMIDLPTEFEIASVYPNPFNPMANVSIALPEKAELKVTVLNVMGQQVAELANGSFNAGVQTFTIDGSNLASGIYFVHATVPGHLNQVQKVMLVR